MTDNSCKVIVVDVDTSSLTLSWPEVRGARRYLLEYEAASASSPDSYNILSDKLTTTSARKRNLNLSDGPFRFRVRARDEIDFIGDVMISDFVNVLSEEAHLARMDAPSVSSNGNCSVLVQWTKILEGNSGVTIQMREDKGGSQWKTIASDFTGNVVRKKNLNDVASYQFRLKPSSNEETVFSQPSITIKVQRISPGLKKLFSGLEKDSLITPNDQQVPLADAVAGKLILLYISAHWCGPCRQFTPQLARFYEANKPDLDIIFLSADHDKTSFESYFRTMPWKAVPYDSDVRERLQAQFKVSSIPRLIVLNNQGQVIEDNAVGKPLNVSQWKSANK